MNKNKFNYFVIFSLLFFLGVVIHNNFISESKQEFSSLDYFFMNLYPSLSIFFMKIINIVFFVCFLYIISKLIKEKWSIFILIFILNPLVYFILTGVNMLFFEVFIIIFTIYLFKSNKKFSLFVYLILLFIFKMYILMYVFLFLFIYLLNQEIKLSKLKIYNNENKEILFSIFTLVIIFLLYRYSNYLNFNFLSDLNFVNINIVYSLVYLIFGIMGLFQLNKMKKINLFQIILLFFVGYYFRNEILVILVINVILSYLVTIYLFSFIFKKWRFLDLKTITLICIVILFVANFFMLDIEKEEGVDYVFECNFEDYILTDIYNYEYVKANNDNCNIKVFEEDFFLNQKDYMDKLDVENFNRVIDSNIIDESENVSNVVDLEELNSSNVDLLSFNQQEIINLDIIDFVSNFFLNSNSGDVERLDQDLKITIYEELFYELDIMNFLNKAIINNVKYVVLSKDSVSEIWDYNFGLISYYKRFKYVEDSNSIILKIYS